jgi:hypothetical protein
MGDGMLLSFKRRLERDGLRAFCIEGRIFASHLKMGSQTWQPSLLLPSIVNSVFLFLVRLPLTFWQHCGFFGASNLGGLILQNHEVRLLRSSYLQQSPSADSRISICQEIEKLQRPVCAHAACPQVYHMSSHNARFRFHGIVWHSWIVWHLETWLGERAICIIIMSFQHSDPQACHKGIILMILLDKRRPTRV